MKLSLAEITTLLGATINSEKNDLINNIASIEHAKKGDITFLANHKYEPYIYTTKATAVIVNKDFVAQKLVSASLIRVEEPYAAFSILLEEYHKLRSFEKTGIEQPSYLDETSKIGKSIYIGAFAYIGKNVIIGNNVKIYPNTYIGDNTNIGNDCILYAGAKIYENTVIGNYCTIQAGAVIGSHGFGFTPNAEGEYKSIPQIGHVILEDHVDVGANTTIDCGTFGATIVRKGVKIDNLVQLAHNTEIGQNTAIAAQSGIAGSTKIGENCILGGQVGILGHITVADGTKIQAQSGVSKASVKGQALYGSPAIDFNNYLRSYSIFKRLPRVLKQIELLEEKILNLPEGKKNS